MGQWAGAKAIETVYAGCRFRSRLEARWATFLDAMELPWQYEPEGFELDGVRYLPDFWLPSLGHWIEIKPVAPTEGEQQKAILLAKHTDKRVFIFVGLPGDGQTTDDITGIGFFPAGNGEVVIHDDCDWSECPYCSLLNITVGCGAPRFLSCGHYADAERELWHVRGILAEMGSRYEISFDDWIAAHRHATTPIVHWGFDSPRLMHAFQAARQARFERN